MIGLDRIEAYISKATEEPWELHRAAFVFDSEGICVADCRWRDIDDESVANADFIAQARSDLPAVVAELREAREVLRKVVEMGEPLSEYGSWCDWCGASCMYAERPLVHKPDCPYVQARKLLGM